MRILHVAEVSHGGVVSLVRLFAQAQASEGHDVHLLLQPDVDAPAGRIHHWQPQRRRPWRLLREARNLQTTVLEVRPDVVHLHSFFPGLLGRLRPLAGTVIYQPHSWSFQAVPFAAARRGVAGWERFATRRTAAVITNCEDEWNEAAAQGVQASAHVVGVPLDTERYSPVDAERQTRVRAELGITSRNVLVCVGRLSSQKGQDLLAAAWERQPLPDTTLFLVGPGDPAYLAELATESFGQSLVHVGSQDDVRPWLWAADLCVLPSRYEGQSVAMAEALACGLPVVMTDVNGAREAVAPSGQDAAGAIVPIGDMDALLAACASRIGPDGHLLDSEGAVARQRAVSLFDQATVMRRIEAVYVSATADRAPEGLAVSRGFVE